MTTQLQVIDGTKLDLSQITIQSKVNKLANGAKVVSFLYGNKPLGIQTPPLYLPWGVSPPFSDKNNKSKGKDEDNESSQHPSVDTTTKTKWGLSMSFKGHDGTDKISERKNKFLQKLKEFDLFFLDVIIKNRKEWFDDDDNTISLAEAKKIYGRILRRTVKERVNKVTKEVYPACIEPKIICDKGNFKCSVVDDNNQPYTKPVNELNLRGSTGVGILVLEGFYIQPSGCGPTWRLEKLRANEAGSTKTDFGFIDFDEDESESKPKANVQIEDSEDESDDDETTPAKGDAEDDSEEESEDEPEPEPEPVVKKGKGKTSTTTTTKAKKA
jgi:hypothetical protein